MYNKKSLLGSDWKLEEYEERLILSSSQKVSPLKLKEKNFRYNFSNLDQALANLNNKLYDNMA